MPDTVTYRATLANPGVRICARRRSMEREEASGMGGECTVSPVTNEVGTCRRLPDPGRNPATSTSHSPVKDALADDFARSGRSTTPLLMRLVAFEEPAT
jgi:hypothetical protein